MEDNAGSVVLAVLYPYQYMNLHGNLIQNKISSQIPTSLFLDIIYVTGYVTFTFQKNLRNPVINLYEILLIQ